MNRSTLNPEQSEVVFHGDGHVLVLAGAGSGKTHTITHRVAYLIEQGVRPEDILLVTFTNKAAREMTERIETVLRGFPHGLWAGTFHSVGNRLLRRYGDALGYSHSFTILDEDDAVSLMKACVKEVGIDAQARRFPSASALHHLSSFARSANQSIRSVLEKKSPAWREWLFTIEELLARYESRKREMYAMDFDDLLSNTLALFEIPALHELLCAQFRYVLVDEYQDTNVIQANMIDRLSSTHQQLLVVGDDAQSIYSFRAAEIQNILTFTKRYPDAKVFQLNKNYRSTPEILSLANAIIASNKDQYLKTLEATRTAEQPPRLSRTAGPYQEAEYILREICTLREQGMPLHEIAVLFRAAFHSQALEFELMKRRIPYDYRGGLRFFERTHIKDVLAFVRIKVNPRDEVAWLRLLGKQPGIGLATAERIITQLREHASLDAIIDAPLSLPQRAEAGWQSLKSTLHRLTSHTLPAQVIQEIVTSEYRTLLEMEYPDAADRLDDLEQFAEFAERYQELQVFLEDISLTAEFEVQTNTVREDRLVLSTIHQAKGLEWDAVFVMRLCEGQFPNPRAVEEGTMEEERRLLYVATTRARRRLYFSYPVSSGAHGFDITAPSCFLQELPSGLLHETRERKMERSFREASDDVRVVLDELGEPHPSVPMKSFLRNIDEV